jgi:hypothetical protein
MTTTRRSTLARGLTYDRRMPVFLPPKQLRIRRTAPLRKAWQLIWPQSKLEYDLEELRVKEDDLDNDE